MRSHDEAEAVSRVILRLRSRFPDVDPMEITHLVERCHRDFDGRPIRDFIPLLIEAEMLKQLQRLPVPEPRPQADLPSPVPGAVDPSLDPGARTLEHT
ncbi:three-helix bundle dimerization domain-containing protein [Nocardioides sp.]|uniref:three-helix bundle dimerization domain-containing protein n=1 Tax=Nocardioides sp. TaxID=35761 RepID=UPI003527DD97